MQNLNVLEFIDNTYVESKEPQSLALGSQARSLTVLCDEQQGTSSLKRANSTPVLLTTTSTSNDIEC